MIPTDGRIHSIDVVDTVPKMKLRIRPTSSSWAIR